MALNPHAEHIYEIASIWLKECLFNDGSLFWPDRKVWTSDNLDSFWSAFAENLDEGEGSFVEKWAQQLSGQNDDVHRMAVEVAAIYCLFPRDQQSVGFRLSQSGQIRERARLQRPPLSGSFFRQRETHGDPFEAILWAHPNVFAYGAASNSEIPVILYMTSRKIKA